MTTAAQVVYCFTMLSDDMAPGPDELYDAVEMRAALSRVWSAAPTTNPSSGALTPNRRDVRTVVLLYGLDGLGHCTKTQLADEFGIAYGSVCEIEKRALRRLKRCPAMRELLSR